MFKTLPSIAALAVAALLTGGSLVGCAPSGQRSVDATNTFAPEPVTGVNGSGDPGATGPGGAHDTLDGSGWNAGPRSDIGGAHND